MRSRYFVIPTFEFDDNKDEFSNYISEHLVVLWVLYFLVTIYCHRNTETEYHISGPLPVERELPWWFLGLYVLSS